jgi:hypothetical protein
VRVQSLHKWTIYGFMSRHRLVKIELLPDTTYTGLGDPGSARAIHRGAYLLVTGHFSLNGRLFLANSITLSVAPTGTGTRTHGKASGGGAGQQGQNDGQVTSPPTHGHEGGRGGK